MTTHFTDFNKPFEYKCADDVWVPAKFLCMRKHTNGHDTVILYDRGTYEYSTHVNSSSHLTRNKVEKRKFWTVTGIYHGSAVLTSRTYAIDPQLVVGNDFRPDNHLAAKVINIVEGEYEV